MRLKGRNDLVTGADLASCRLMKQQLKRFFPGHSFLAEEPEFSENNRSDFLWIIDPLDGTTFHNRGLPFFSSILALEVRGQTELGLGFEPFYGRHIPGRTGERLQLLESKVAEAASGAGLGSHESSRGVGGLQLRKE